MAPVQIQVQIQQIQIRGGGGLVIGGNKSMLFNAEYLISIAGPVRLVLFYDAGQVRDNGEKFGWKEPIKQLVTLNGLAAADALTSLYAVGGFKSTLATRVDTIGQTSAFKTSTGAEIRFFMPVLNVPFRLIFAANPSRGNVLDNNLQREKLYDQFRRGEPSPAGFAAGWRGRRWPTLAPRARQTPSTGRSPTATAAAAGIVSDRIRK